MEEEYFTLTDLDYFTSTRVGQMTAKLIIQLIFKLTKTFKLDFDPSVEYEKNKDKIEDRDSPEYVERCFIGLFPHKNFWHYRAFENELVPVVSYHLNSFPVNKNIIINDKIDQHNFLFKYSLLDWVYRKALLIGVNFEIRYSKFEKDRLSFRINNGKWHHMAIINRPLELPYEFRLPYICQTHTKRCNCDKNFHFMWYGLTNYTWVQVQDSSSKIRLVV